MATVEEHVTIRFQKPTSEAHWADADPPPEAPALEGAVRAALAGQGDDLRVLFRQDGTRWRVQVESGLEPSRDLTQRAVEALRRAGYQTEPGFPADPAQPQLPVGEVE